MGRCGFSPACFVFLFIFTPLSFSLPLPLWSWERSGEGGEGRGGDGRHPGSPGLLGSGSSTSQPPDDLAVVRLAGGSGAGSKSQRLASVSPCAPRPMETGHPYFGFKRVCMRCQPQECPALTSGYFSFIVINVDIFTNCPRSKPGVLILSFYCFFVFCFCFLHQSIDPLPAVTNTFL